MRLPKLNFRILLFVAVLFALPGTLMYIYFDSVLSGGIKDRGTYLEVDLKAMSDFPFDQVNGTAQDIPKQWRELDGRRIMVQGEQYSPNDARPEQEQFQLVYSIAQCCLTSTPQIQHFVDARAVEGKLPVHRGLVKVLGTIHVDVQRENGRVSRVYRMEVERVDPV